MKKPNKDEVIAILDRLEGEHAVILFGKVAVSVPRSLLPPAAREGDAFTVELRPSPEETARRRKETAQMIERLRKRA